MWWLSMVALWGCDAPAEEAGEDCVRVARMTYEAVPSEMNPIEFAAELDASSSDYCVGDLAAWWYWWDGDYYFDDFSIQPAFHDPAETTIMDNGNMMSGQKLVLIIVPGGEDPAEWWPCLSQEQPSGCDESVWRGEISTAEAYGYE